MEHHFVIRYTSKNNKKKMLNIVFKLIEELKLENFIIEEKEAFRNDRILYNENTILKNELDYEKFKEKIQEFI